MEKMKINSKTQYNRARVRNGYEPHRILRMIQEQMLEDISEKATKEEVKK